MKFLSSLINEKWFVVLLAFLAGLAVVFMPGAIPAAIEIMTLKLLYVVLLLSVVFALIFVLRGTSWDFYEEIIGQHNVAGAIFVAALVIAIAVVIGK